MPATITSIERSTFGTTLHFCHWCGRHTRHELRARNMVCLECADHVLMRELDRD